MTLSTQLGWWLVPFAVTVLSITFVSRRLDKRDPKGYGQDPIGTAIILLLVFGCAAIVSLAAWLIWALMN